MRKSLLMLSAAVAIMGLASSASAGITNGSIIVVNPPSEDISQFSMFNYDPYTYDSGTFGEYNQFNTIDELGKYTWNGGGETTNVDIPFVALGPSTVNPNYSMVIGGNSFEDVRGALAQRVTFWWESPDPYNYVTFVNFKTGATDTIWGNQLGVSNDGSVNALVTITMNYQFNEILFGSEQYNSFEFAAGRDFTSGVPEIPSWAMMGLGFASFGVLFVKRSRKDRLAPSL